MLLCERAMRALGYVLLLGALAAHVEIRAQAGSCPNTGFENGDFTNWTGVFMSVAPGGPNALPRPGSHEGAPLGAGGSERSERGGSFVHHATPHPGQCPSGAGPT